MKNRKKYKPGEQISVTLYRGRNDIVEYINDIPNISRYVFNLLEKDMKETKEKKEQIGEVLNTEKVEDIIDNVVKQRLKQAFKEINNSTIQPTPIESVKHETKQHNERTFELAADDNF